MSIYTCQGCRRKARAQLLLEQTDQDVDITIRKVKKLFHKDLAFSASSGFSSLRMFVAIRGIAGLIQPDVQPSERLNKCLSLFGERCPSGSLELCTGRAALKHFIGRSGYGLGGKNKKFSAVKETAKLLLEECTAGWPLIEDVESNPARFAAAEPRSDLCALERANKIYKELDPASFPKVTAATIWAASMNLKLRKRLSEREFTMCKDGLRAIACVMPPNVATMSPMIFLLTDKVRATLHLVCFRRQQQEGNNPARYAISHPWVFVKSHDLLLRFHRLLKSDKKGAISVVEFLVHVHEVPWLTIFRYTYHIN